MVDIDDDDYSDEIQIAPRDDNNNTDKHDKNTITRPTSSVDAALRQRIAINRPVYTHKQFETEFGLKEKKPRSLVRQECKKFLRCIDPRNLIGIFTVLNWVSEYNFKKNLIPDILSGLTGLYLTIDSNKMLILY
jgi:hypothetical protein